MTTRVLRVLLTIVMVLTVLAAAHAANQAAPTTQSAPTALNWRASLAAALPLMGHRNWICVVDSAYPLQARPGIETVVTGDGQLDVVKAVLEAIGKAKHVRANVFVDRELAFVPEQFARGIGAYRGNLKRALGKANPVEMPHEDIIKKLDEAAQTFNVLILKTDMALPYTSVFFQLDCGYWSAEAEAKLREAMQAAEVAAEAGK